MLSAMTAPERLANRHLDSSILEPLSEPPDRARIVVIGGGVAGSSVAYHLTKLGAADVVVLERTRLTGGTTWHAAGLVAQVRGTHALTELSRVNAPLYESLPMETGVETGLRRVGALTVARTRGRVEELRAGLSMAKDFGIEAHELTPQEVRKYWPEAEVDDLVGAFEPKGKPKAPGDIDTGGFVEFGEDWEHFAPVLANARERLPVLRDIGFEHYLRGPESFTPDANFHLGEFPEAPGLWIAAGFNSQGIIFSPGAGKALAEWIVEGHPTMDLTEVDIARTGRWANDRGWLHEKTSETLGRLYAMHWPALQPSSGRGIRRLPLADRCRTAGAAFGEAAGWERPAWFEPGATEEPVWLYDFDRPSWFGPVGEEMAAARGGVALFDLTTYSKFLVQGPGSVDGLQWLCASDVDVPIGRVVYTLLCNDRGGIEMDPTVTRLAEQIFLVVAPTAYQRRTEALLRTGLPSEATVTDVTSAFAVLHLAGPRSRDLLQRMTDADLSDDAFPFRSARRIEAGAAQPWALRVSYTGELGWELYVPTEFVGDLYDRVVEAGKDLGLRHAGSFAFDSLRLERGFRSWGHDMGGLDDPFEVGLGFAVHLTKGDFAGAEALRRLKEEPRERRLLSIRLDDPAPMLWHAESVVAGDERVGHVTSGG